jgi:hypothetical protein
MAGNKKKCIVYGLFSFNDPNQIRYVGQTVQPIEGRFRAHLNVASNSKNKSFRNYVYNWIRYHNYRIGYVILQENATYNFSEKRWIEDLRYEGHRLTNLTDGGDGSLGFKGKRGIKLGPLSEETKQKIGESGKLVSL